jgi:hypothetical protein
MMRCRIHGERSLWHGGVCFAALPMASHRTPLHQRPIEQFFSLAARVPPGFLLRFL